MINAKDAKSLSDTENMGLGLTLGRIGFHIREAASLGAYTCSYNASHFKGAQINKIIEYFKELGYSAYLGPDAMIFFRWDVV